MHRMPGLQSNPGDLLVLARFDAAEGQDGTTGCREGCRGVPSANRGGLPHWDHCSASPAPALAPLTTGKPPSTAAQTTGHQRSTRLAHGGQQVPVGPQLPCLGAGQEELGRGRCVFLEKLQISRRHVWRPPGWPAPRHCQQPQTRLFTPPSHFLRSSHRGALKGARQEAGNGSTMTHGAAPAEPPSPPPNAGTAPAPCMPGSPAPACDPHPRSTQGHAGSWVTPKPCTTEAYRGGCGDPPRKVGWPHAGTGGIIRNDAFFGVSDGKPAAAAEPPDPLQKLWDESMWIWGQSCEQELKGRWGGGDLSA
ncbi:uncharacterized protein LOC129784407 [Falco peregrinus]|uniref:uncharacterized protein LOC129784407 n=1 Tax=Falco peregrinus TaxID=8954 RepID=UPI002479627B|nr:uncharacterized protein LOC129784407 [Falco peregrinus]